MMKPSVRKLGQAGPWHALKAGIQTPGPSSLYFRFGHEVTSFIICFCHALLLCYRKRKGETIKRSDYRGQKKLRTDLDFVSALENLFSFNCEPWNVISLCACFVFLSSVFFIYICKILTQGQLSGSGSHTLFKFEIFLPLPPRVLLLQVLLVLNREVM